jgi:TIR domain
MARIFISYRRSESAYVAAPLSEKLQQRFGQDSVFYDIDNIPLGVDFREHIGNAVGQCDVLLVLIGEQWLTAADKTGKKRLDDAGDYVRIEIESALKRNIPVIPVLLGEATMPSADDLPESLKDIVYRNAAELRAGSNWRHHTERLMNGLENLFKLNEEVQKPTEAVEKKQTLQTQTEIKKPVEDILDSKSRLDKRSKVMQIIKSGLQDFTDSYFFVGKAIPAYKITNAIATYAPNVEPKDVLLLTDQTLFGGAKRGLILTTDALYHVDHHTPFFYTQIKSAEIKKATQALAVLSINGKEMDVIANDAVKLATILIDILRKLAKF